MRVPNYNSYVETWNNYRCSKDVVEGYTTKVIQLPWYRLKKITELNIIKISILN